LLKATDLHVKKQNPVEPAYRQDLDREHCQRELQLHPDIQAEPVLRVTRVSELQCRHTSHNALPQLGIDPTPN
jgi:hypothetical protein